MDTVFPDVDSQSIRRRPVAIIGVGGVASYAHIPAYRAVGAEVVALHDRDDAALERAASACGGAPARFGIDGFDAFCTWIDGRVGVLDVCTPSPSHAEMIHAILDRLGDRTPPLLVQKPLAPTQIEARGLVERCRVLGVPLAVNLNARWVPAFARTIELVRGGAVGQPVAVTVVNRGLNRKTPDSWRGGMQRLVIGEMAVHHLDLLVELFGAPRWVFARTRSVPGWDLPGESIAHMQIGFDDGPAVTVVEDWACHARSAHRFHPTGEQIIVEGTRATLVCTPTSVELWQGDEVRREESTFAWFPDAFRGPYLHLVDALERGATLRIDGASFLRIAALVDAAYLSAATTTVVPIGDEDNAAAA